MMGLGFRIAPGVRVRVSSRGVRTSLGPRIARVHVGAGRTTLSTGAGPVTLWSTPGARRSPSPARSRTPTLAQLQGQAAATQRAQAEADRQASIRALQDMWTALLSAHREAFPPAERPLVPEPAWVRPEQYVPDLERQHLASVSRFDRAGRDHARLGARQAAEEAAARFNTSFDVPYRKALADAEQYWTMLLGNDEATVMQAVNAAFEDNASFAAALCVDDASLSVLMIQPTVEQFPDQEVATTPGGKLTIKKMTKTAQRTRWTAITTSRSTATIAEAFAVAPGIDMIELAVVARAEGNTGPYRPVITGEIRREQFAAIDWPHRAPHDLLQMAGAVTAKVDRYGALAALSTEGDPDLEAMMVGINSAVDDEEDEGEDDEGTDEEAGEVAASDPLANVVPNVTHHPGRATRSSKKRSQSFRKG